MSRDSFLGVRQLAFPLQKGTHLFYLFLERMDSKLGRVVVPRKRGRPKKEDK